MAATELELKPLSPSTWSDFEAVMGSNGGARGCWCMHWRLSMGEWMDGRGEGNKAAMYELANHEPTPGVIAYADAVPVAWCGFGDRSDYPRMRRSPVMRPIDDEPVISITCLFIRRGHRGAGLLPALIAAVCDHLAQTSDVDQVEAYPVHPPSGRRAGADTAMTGIASAFTEAGFTEVARPKHDRPVMRCRLR